MREQQDVNLQCMVEVTATAFALLFTSAFLATKQKI